MAGRPSSWVESGGDSGDGEGAMDEDSDESWVEGGEGYVARSAGGEGEREKSESGEDIGESERRSDEDLEGIAGGEVAAK